MGPSRRLLPLLVVSGVLLARGVGAAPGPVGGEGEGTDFLRFVEGAAGEGELQTAIDTFVKTIPDFRVAPGFAVPFFLSNVIHVEELPLVWG